MATQIRKKIAIAANFTIAPISTALKYYLRTLGEEAEIEIALFDQIFQQFVDKTSLFRQNADGANVVFLRIADMIQRSDDSNFEVDERLQLVSNVDEFIRTVRNTSPWNVPLFVFICPYSVSAIGTESAVFLNDLEAKVLESLGHLENVYIFSTHHIPKRYELSDIHDPRSFALGRVAYKNDFYRALAAEVARNFSATTRLPYKVLVLDCDNTLWDGICGEDGLTDLVISTPRLALQSFAIEQANRGMLLCLCSKNNEQDVWNVFDRRSDMLLQKTHLVSSRINWEPKSTNLRSLATELDLGLDAFVFIDDDPAVCAEVKRNCPAVATVSLPPDKFVPGFLEHLWLFDRLNVTVEDRNRSKSYRVEAARRSAAKTSPDLAGFLASLQLVCEIAEIQDTQVPRVSQLSLRTNQFNSTTVRRSEAEIRRIIATPNRRLWTVTLSDRFGDYGLVGTVSSEERPESLYIDSFMLSCRALGRGVEHRMLQELGTLAVGLGLRFVDIEFRPTERNAPIEQFLAGLGITPLDAGESMSLFRIETAAAVRAEPGSTIVSGREQREPIIVSLTGNSQSRSYDACVLLATQLSQGTLLLKELEPPVLERPLNDKPFISPRTDTESRLAKLWKDHLNISCVGITDDFFELGGNSLLAVGILVEIEEQFGLRIPLSALVESSTVKALARMIDQPTASARWRYLVPLRVHGTQRPLFCIHAAGGNVLFYRDLASELDANVDVYGLQARGVSDKRETAHDRVEDMARDYLAEIRSVQPYGPYRLCGSSFGGLVAFEIAQQLQLAGERVEFVGLFDTYAPGYLSPAQQSRLLKIERALLRIRTITRQLAETQTTRGRLDFLRQKFRKLDIRIKRRAAWRRNQFDIKFAAATGKELPIDFQRNHRAISNAETYYKPTKFHGSLVLFRASEQPSNVVFDPYLGWADYTTEHCVVEVVNGMHGALTVNPFARHLAEKLNSYLVQGSTSGDNDGCTAPQPVPVNIAMMELQTRSLLKECVE